jgi:NADPH-dependent ferric siderophore reductase
VSLTYIEGDMFFDDPNPPLPHDAIRVLFAGDASSLPALREMLASLPICARGQVFVEVGGVDVHLGGVARPRHRDLAGP